MDVTRVLHLTERLDFAGAGANLPLYLKFANHDLFDVTMGSFFESDQRRKEILEGGGIRTHDFYGEMENLAKYLEQQGVDILHISGGELPGGHLKPFAKTAKKSKVKVVTHLNFFAHGDGDGLDLTFLQNKTMAWKYMRKNGITPERFWERCRILPVPVDVERIDALRPSEHEILRIKDKLGIADSPTICRLGRPDPFKWSYFLLYAFRLLRVKVSGAKLVIIGGIPNNVRKKIDSLGLSSHVVDVGEVSDDEVIRTLHSIDILAHSSRIGESFSAAIAQAMAYRKPVVVNSTPWADNGQLEQIDKWADGLLATTAEEYADCCAKLLKDPFMRKRMGDNGYTKIRLAHSARVATRMLEKFYVDALVKKGFIYSDSVARVTPPDELSSWPIEYRWRLKESGYTVNRISGKLLHYLWKGTLLFPSLREAIPADGIMASIV